MKRNAFLFKAASLPVAVNALLVNKLFAGNMTPSTKTDYLEPAPDNVTVDVFKGNFPPASYGHTPQEIEATIQQVVETVFRDEDGMMRSGVNGNTMKPMRVEEVKNRRNLSDLYTECSSVPRSAKPIWMNYENSGQACGSYLEVLCLKADITGDKQISELARKTVDAIILLWNNAARIKHPLGGDGKGWLPKPYEGIRNLDGMFECSVDQYCDTTLGLHTYYLTLADNNEKRQIEEVVLSFADWWIDHDFCGVYFGKAIYWKRLKWHSMAASYFLYLYALAQSWKPSPRYRDAFKTWFTLKEALHPEDKPTWLGMPGITLNCLEKLSLLRPDLNYIWQPEAAYHASWLVKCIQEGDIPHNTKNFGIGYLTTAHRLFPGKGYDILSEQYMEEYSGRKNFYHIKRGLSLAALPKAVAGDDYLNVFWCEGHVHWLLGYWNARLQNSPKNGHKTSQQS